MKILTTADLTEQLVTELDLSAALTASVHLSIPECDYIYLKVYHETQELLVSTNDLQVILEILENLHGETE